jgi:hypothetical protein
MDILVQQPHGRHSVAALYHGTLAPVVCHNFRGELPILSRNHIGCILVPEKRAEFRSMLEIDNDTRDDEGCGAVVMIVDVMVFSPAFSARLLTPTVGLVITDISLDGL